MGFDCGVDVGFFKLGLIVMLVLLFLFGFECNAGFGFDIAFGSCDDD